MTRQYTTEEKARLMAEILADGVAVTARRNPAVPPRTLEAWLRCARAKPVKAIEVANGTAKGLAEDFRRPFCRRDSDT
jgi:transposase-like protein